MPDGALMEDYIVYSMKLDRDKIVDEFNRPRIENGVHPDCPPGTLVNYMFYPLGPEYGVMLLSTLWYDQDFVVSTGSKTYAIDPCKMLECLFKSKPLDEAGRFYRCQIMQLDSNESNKLIKELIFACNDSFVTKDLDALCQPLSELIEEHPDHPHINQMKHLLETLRTSKS